MNKTYLLIFIFYFGLFSCTKKQEKLINNPLPDASEKKVQHLFEKVVVQKSFAIDSAEKYFSSLDSLTTLKKDYQAKKELIKGSIYLKKASLQLSLSYYENALQLVDSSSLLADYALQGMGTANKSLGNYPKALLDLHQSITNNEARKDTLRLSGTYTILAQLYQEKEDFDKAKDAINKVFELLKNNDTSRSYLITLHTLANVEAQSGNFTKAMEIDKRGIAIADKIGNTLVKTSFQDNLARCNLFFLKDYNQANYYFKENLKIDKQLNNPAWIADTYINLAEVATAESKFIIAENYLKEAIKIFTESKQLNNALKGSHALAALYQKQGKLQKALDAKEAYMEQYKKFINEKGEQSIAEYNILFETHKKEKELANANLQIAENKLISRQKNLWLIALGCALFIGIIVLRNQKVKASFTKKKLQLENQLLQEQAQSQIQQQRLAISRDLHDSIGAQLTFINSILDGLKNLSAQLNDTINKKINTLAEFSENSITELRNTLWVLNSKEIFLDDLKVKILNYINHAAEAKETMQFHFNFEAPENYLLSSRQAINLFRAVQEIITNAIKYSFAKEILINITQKEKLLAIKIADNGTGFDFEKLKTKSYGLSNIQNRVAEINGSLKVETGEGKGTTYFIEIHL